MDRLVSPMRSVLLIGLMLDCGGRRETERGRKREMGRGKKRSRESAAGMRPQGARLGLGQGFRNAPQESPSEGQGRAGRMLLWRVERGGWLRKGQKNAPPEHPFYSGAEVKGLSGGRGECSLPPSGSRMAADQVSMWGSASCRQGFRLPWGGDRRLEAQLFHRPFQKHFINALSFSFTLSLLYLCSLVSFLKTRLK